VPPLALMDDQVAGVYRLNVSAEKFKSAPEIDLSKWHDNTHGVRIAAAYRYFDQEPYFLEQGAPPSLTPRGHPKVALGYVELSSKMLDLPVQNRQGEKFGEVASLSLDVIRGRILNVVILAPGNSAVRSMVPAMALSFNDRRDGLVLNDTKVAYDNEPRLVLNQGAYGQDSYATEEPLQGSQASVAFVQGRSNRDLDLTVRINKTIRVEKINARNVDVVTNLGRVTLRGWVDTEADKRRIGEVAIAAARAEDVDNQIVVGKPVAAQ